MAKKNSPHTNSPVIRYNWGAAVSVLPHLDLIAVQKESYNWFITEGLKNLLAEISPVEDFTGKNWTLEVGGHRFDKPRYSEQECLAKGLTFDSPLKVETILTNKQTGKQVKQE